MRLRFVNDYLSVTQFDDVVLPNFSVITGVNGAGKSHLLTAIINKAVQIVDIPEAKVVLFNYANFRLENEGRVAVYQMETERRQVWKAFSTGSNGKDLPQILADLVSSTLTAECYEGLKTIAAQSDKPLLSLGREDVGDADILDKLRLYQTRLEDEIRTKRQLNGQHQNAVLNLASRLKVGIHELREDEFVGRLTLNTNDTVLPRQMSRVFSDYYSKLDANRYRAYRNSEFGQTLEVLSDEEFEKRHGPKPWEVINAILERFGTLPYRITSPEHLERNDEFVAALQHQDNPDVKPTFDHLSSGEKILMALVATVYTSTSAETWPDILLLDEIDASLHPSMIQNLLDVVTDTFLQKGMKVVLVSHSPTTLALAPEEAIFIMNRYGTKRIVKKSKKDALSVLTEGFATLDEGVKLFDQVSRLNLVILTEGRNTAYIRKLISLNEISGVDVMDALTDRSGKTQLKSIFDFFAKVPHETRVLLVWDPDANRYRCLGEQNKTTPFVLPHNPDNRIAVKGVENLFPEILFQDYKKTVTDSRGNVVESFDERRKIDFENFILKRDNPEDFQLFDPLVRKIRELAAKTDC